MRRCATGGGGVMGSRGIAGRDGGVFIATEESAATLGFLLDDGSVVSV